VKVAPAFNCSAIVSWVSLDVTMMFDLGNINRHIAVAKHICLPGILLNSCEPPRPKGRGFRWAQLAHFVSVA